MSNTIGGKESLGRHTKGKYDRQTNVKYCKGERLCPPKNNKKQKKEIYKNE